MLEGHLNANVPLFHGLYYVYFAFQSAVQIMILDIDIVH